MEPNLGFWGNLGLAGSLDSALLLTRAQYNSNNHLMGGSAWPRPVTPCQHRPHALGGRAED